KTDAQTHSGQQRRGGRPTRFLPPVLPCASVRLAFAFPACRPALFPGMRRLAAVLAMATACRAGPASSPPLRLGTTYTVQQSGALAVLESLWTSPAPLTTVVAPSGQI